jgi:hypothetical protein
VAVTVKVAACPRVTVVLAGWEVTVGAVTVGSLAPPEFVLEEPVSCMALQPLRRTERRPAKPKLRRDA